MDKASIKRFLEDTAHVQGWFFPIDAYLFGMVDDVQKRSGIAGDLFEIGVHHGKTAILLARMARQGESLGVCDVFERQDLNHDGSGRGSRAVFTENLAKHGGLKESQIKVLAKPSDTVRDDEIDTNYRVFHIDGGHLADIVWSDLRLADAVTRRNGAVILDDVFNPSWPGVGEGFYRFMSSTPGSFVPIIIGGNKVVLTRPEAAERYTRHWANADTWRTYFEPGPYWFTLKEWLGVKVLTAVRQEFVDLNPIAAAKQHLHGKSWNDRWKRVVLKYL
jgi:hypothetical protein